MDSQETTSYGENKQAVHSTQSRVHFCFAKRTGTGRFWLVSGVFGLQVVRRLVDAGTGD